MTATASPAEPAPGARSFDAPPSRGLAARLVAGVLHVSTGLVLGATVLGLGIASSIIARGVVVASPSDVATIQALTPLFALFGLVAAGHVAAGLGTLFASRAAAGLGIGLGAFDAVAGFVALVVAATGRKGQVDGVGIAVTFVLAGIVLAVSARAADWATHGPVDAD